jgi:hypothetical protein
MLHTSMRGQATVERVPANKGTAKPSVMTTQLCTSKGTAANPIRKPIALGTLAVPTITITIASRMSVRANTKIAVRPPLQPPHRLGTGEARRLLCLRRVRPRNNRVLKGDPIHGLKGAVKPNRYRCQNGSEPTHPP